MPDSSQHSPASHASTAELTLADLGVDPARGLSEAEARNRLRRVGPNRLRQALPGSAWLVLVDQFRSLIVALLAVALGLALVARDWPEAIAIGVVIVINAAIGFISELRAIRSMEALRRLGRATANVRRDSKVRQVPAESLVPGDIIIIEGGDLVTTDLRLVEASKLQADESVLTGESAPVDKQVEPVPEDAPLAERSNTLFKGTAVTRGSGLGVVVASGMETELGRISALVEEGLERADTPLERRLSELGRALVWLTVAMTIVVIVAGIASGKPVLLIVKTAVALAVAAVPEGLPIVATLALARGMWRMARRNALIRRLAAVETLGTTTVICADKTGTLTENRMTVVQLVTADGRVEVSASEDGEAEFGIDGARSDPLADAVLKRMLQACVLCNNAELPGESAGERRRIGDPMEVALLEVGAKAGLPQASLREAMPEVKEVAFDPEVKMMATFHREDGGLRVLAKGAPEAVLQSSSSVLGRTGRRTVDAEERARWLQLNESLAAEGLRVLAVATKDVTSPDVEPYEDLELLGLVALVDPPRPDVGEAIAACQSAGVRVVMVTGDQAATARYVGRALHLTGADEVHVVEGSRFSSAGADEESLLRAPIFARMSPAQKLDLIRLYQSRGEIVAMTGDGVNDAPALKSADIGIAMGRRGTEVAREAADMVLRDDAFSTIVHSVEQGRIIFDNIRSFICYLISCNISEVLVVLIAAVMNLPLPMLPLQILFLNLVTDVFPALALGFGEGDRGVMTRAPRSAGEPVLARRHWLWIALHGLLLAAVVLGALVAALRWLDLDEAQAVTVSFLTLAFAQLWHVFNMRRPDSPLLVNEVTRNLYVWGAVALCIGLILGAAAVPPVAQVLDIVDPGAKGWSLILVSSLIPAVVGQVGLALARGAGEGGTG